MAGLNAAPGGGWDYIQADTPADPEKGESWYDTDGGTDGNGEAKVYDGTQWDVTGYISHDQLNNVSAADHHDPVTVTAPLTRSAQALALALGNALTVDANDDLAVDESAISLSNLSGYPIGTGDLGFDTATQSELDGHAGDTTNPHNVTDDQTGAAAALSNHESDPDRHHSQPTGTQSQSVDGTFRTDITGTNSAYVILTEGETGTAVTTVTQPQNLIVASGWQSDVEVSPYISSDTFDADYTVRVRDFSGQTHFLESGTLTQDGRVTTQSTDMPPRAVEKVECTFTLNSAESPNDDHECYVYSGYPYQTYVGNHSHSI
ncbi:hypothetical protein EGH21_05400 [Halomicroarcula sp. F13]|uniref:Uncharacterized protein n=1 Tax=Haloarcula rubra TaxID=2487747 RepID=A0AAW4PQ61_9EURY|nr:hypothetical protein [Halomicroarcula rubra]MBX0322462.1 hypothetical protein [Halomicroarcula rubra]